MAGGIANAIGQVAYDQRPNGPRFSSDTLDDAGKRTDFIPGDWGYIQNTGTVGVHAKGQEGENIIYVGGGKYWGHLGPGLLYQNIKQWSRKVYSWNQGSTVVPQRIRPKAGLSD